MKFAPPEIANAMFVCACCQKVNPVPLAKSFSTSLAPVIPKDINPKNKKYWALQAIEVDCSKCLSKTMLQLPSQKLAGHVFLYGDDAHRANANNKVFCFSLVGGSKPFIEKICDDLIALKKVVEPSRPPSSWVIHMKELHSGDHRKRHQVFAAWDRQKLNNFIDSIFDILKQNSSDIFIFNISFFQKNNPDIMDLKVSAYITLLCDAIYGFTKRGLSPNFFFDSEREFKGIGSVVHQWAHNSFSSSQKLLLYSYVSQGIPVPEPQFVKPASHPCLELADFVSFIVARGHDRTMKKLPIDYPTERLGKVFYSWMRSDGNYGRDRLVGAPWHEIFEDS